MYLEKIKVRASATFKKTIQLIGKDKFFDLGWN